MSHGHIPLAVCGELGPHLGQTQVVVEPAGRDEGMHERAEDALGGRTSEEQGAGGHGFATDRIGDAALCVGNECAVLHHDGLKADLITVRHERVEDCLHGMLERDVSHRGVSQDLSVRLRAGCLLGRFSGHRQPRTEELIGSG
jgi:hypothetical protein